MSATRTDTPGTPPRDPVALRRHLHDMWTGVAAGWEEHAAYADARSGGVTARLLALADPRPGERVLELACGAGGTGIAAAARVAPGGEVVVSDVVERLARFAEVRAVAAGQRNVRGRALDLEAIDEPDASFDVALCREGLMLTADPLRAVHELRRVLRPGGRAAVAVWGPRARNPWLGLVFDAVSAQVGEPVPPPGLPGPFSLDTVERLAGVLTAGGLAEVAVEEVAVPLRAATFDEWWARTTALAGPLARRLAGLPPAAADALRARAQEAVGRFATPAGIELPGVALVAGALRPA